MVLISKKGYHFRLGCIKNATQRRGSFKFGFCRMLLQRKATQATPELE